MRIISTLSLAIFLTFMSTSFGQDEDKKPTDPAHAEKMAKSLKLFKTTVRQVLVSHCLQCHGGEKTESDFSVATRKEFLAGGVTELKTEIGKANESYFADLLYHREEPAMPKNSSKLNDKILGTIMTWIDLGAAYDRPLVESDKELDAWTRRRIDQAQKDYWAYQPLAMVKIRSDLHPNPQNPIDHFIATGIEKSGLEVNKKAPSPLLVRRIFLDMLGMPPTSAEIATLMDNPADKVLSATVDYVLSDSRYGERWARHWLDVARFAESHGFEHDYDRPHAYHYRDFVIKALNQDMPYDRFTRFQLAGDEIEPNNPLAMMATGFLGAGVFPTQITANEVEPSRYDALDDMAATTGTAMLGLTIGCARCHDHKFDPIPSADYYRFTSTFTTAVRSNQQIEMPDADLPQRLAAFEASHQPFVDAVKEYETARLLESFVKWEASQGDQPNYSWYTMKFFDVTSEKGSEIKRLDDGSFKVTPSSATNQESFTFEFHSHRRDIRAIRVEAFADPTLNAGGPGLASNGNFQFTNLHAGIAPLTTPNELKDAKFTAARATFNQNEGLHVRTVIDDKPNTGWAIDPEFGKDHAGIFTLAEPLDDESGHRLRMTLSFNGNTKHIFGHFKITVGANPDAELLGPSVSENVAAILEKPHDARSDDEIQLVLQWYKFQDATWKELDSKRKAHLKEKPTTNVETVMIVSEGVTPLRHHTQGKDFFEEFYFLKRGDVRQKNGEASQSFLQVLSPEVDSIDRWQESPENSGKTSGRRRALANWMTDSEHGAGNLLARVIVNRLWYHHFGRGIVSSTNDFGVQGELPTHPALLDWLAAQLISSDWSLKHIHRLILSSYTYQQSSEFDSKWSIKDPQNKFVWRFAPRRLEAEAIRDSILKVSNQLDDTMYGAGTLDESMRRRSIYFMIKRSKLIPMLQVFDSPEPLVSQGQRPTTTVAPQALLLMNNPNIRQYCVDGAKQLLGESSDETAVVHELYMRSLSREPSKQEIQQAVAFLSQQTESYKSTGVSTAEQLAMADLIQVMLCLNEFCYIY